MHMVRLVQNQIDLTEIDLVLVDYSCNDAFTLSQNSTDADKALLITTETILRAFIAHNASIPVIYISEFLQHSFSEAIYEKVILSKLQPFAYTL